MNRISGGLFAGTLAAAHFLVAAAPSRPDFPDNSDKFDARLQMHLEHAPLETGLGMPNGLTTSNIVDVFVRGDLDADFLSQMGAEPGTVIGDLATARATLEVLEELADSPRIREIRAASPVYPLLDKNRIETRVTDMWGTQNPPNYPASGFTGRGVIVGIVDSGIDFNHPDFKHPNGTTRVLYIWDQNFGPGLPPAGFTYGQEWSAALIDAGLSVEMDAAGHGTHVAGGVAGNGRATGNGYPAYRYVGMAPEADLVVVKLNGGNDAQVLDGVNYIFKKADALGRDAVVCVSVGKQSGPHDGTDPLDVGIDRLSGPGHIVVAAAGNEGKTKIHSRLRVARNQTRTASFVVPAYTPIGTPHIDWEGWFDQGQVITVKVTSPAGFVLGPLSMGQNGTMTNTDGWTLLQWTIPASGPREIFCTTAPPGAGEWKIEIQNTGTPTAVVDFWLTNFILSQNKVPTMLQGQNDSTCIASPASATQAIAASAYCVKRSWVASNGQTLSYTGAILGEIADFSSFGPRRDGVAKPDIAASGYGMASALSANAVFPGTSVVDDGLHVMLTGTSVAASVGAGAVALLLDQFPDLDPASARTILRNRAVRDAFTGTTLPSVRWGWGKLSLANPTSGVTDPPGPGHDHLEGVRLGAPYPNPARNLTRVQMELSRESMLEAAIFDTQGREVRRLHSGRLAAGLHSLSWDATSDANHPVTSGHYYLAVWNESGRESRIITIAR